MTRRLDVGERRRRLAVRHHLAPGHGAVDPAEVADRLVALHSSDPATVHLAVAARSDAGIADVERALHVDRTMLRMRGPRRSVFACSLDSGVLVHAACHREVAAWERDKLTAVLAESGIHDAGSWLPDAEADALAALAARGEAVPADLADDVERLRIEIGPSTGVGYGSRQRIAGRVLYLLAADGRAARGRPRGTWASGQYTWRPMTDFYPGGLPRVATDDAEDALARRWLTTYGPATETDLRWWTGWTITRTRRVLARIAPAEVDLDGAPGLLLPDDLDPVPDVDPWAALLPGLDPTVMGWKDRRWYLGEHERALTDYSGNVGTTVWWDGRVVGVWGQDRDGVVVCGFADDVGSEARTAVDAEASRLTRALDGVRLGARARSRSPLEASLLPQVAAT